MQYLYDLSPGLLLNCGRDKWFFYSLRSSNHQSQLLRLF
uniref:Uncharacterized protein n=1 Tax=Rhizophora mucronata TaxID=61149 RepID=A0A2P2P3D6_RHIMU